jgi:hypothetical protein
MPGKYNASEYAAAKTMVESLPYAGGGGAGAGAVAGGPNGGAGVGGTGGLQAPNIQYPINPPTGGSLQAPQPYNGSR